MDLSAEKVIYKELSYELVGIAMEVHSGLGCGFLEKVYENALMISLEQKGIKAIQQSPLNVMFCGHVVGEYFADILVEDKIIVELKACDKLHDIHKAQVINYLKATKKRLGLLINFGKRSFEYERLVN